MSRDRLYWLCQIMGWSIYGLANIFIYSIFRDIGLNQVLGQVLHALYYLLSTHIFRFIIKRNGWLNSHWKALIPRALIVIILLSVSNYAYLLLISYYLGMLVPESDFTTLAMIVNLIGPFFIYFIWSMIYFIVHYFEKYNKSLQMEAALNEIELNNLKSQLNPHFIFNALNSIRGLVDEDPHKSKVAITQLSLILRNSLLKNKDRLISFQEEMKTVMDYLNLEAIRYEERLNTEIDIAQGSENYYIPPMMIQTLVENGIKHGIAQLTYGGKISLKTKVRPECLEIQIRNSGQYINRSNQSTGTGLENTIKRLGLIYGESANFKIENENDHTVLTKILIPEKYENDHNR